MTICTAMRMITPWDLQVDTYYDALNPDGQHGYPANNSLLSSWSDLGTRGNTQSQATGGLQPTFIRNANNNFPAVSFNGAQWMSCAASANNAYQGAMTVLGVWQATVSGTSGTQRMLTKILSWAYSLLNQNYNWNVWVSATGANIATTSNPITSGAYQEMTINYNRGTNVSFYKNESLLETDAFTNANDAGSGNLYLCSRDGTQQYVTGAVQEILLFFRQLSNWELAYMHLWTKVGGNL